MIPVMSLIKFGESVKKMNKAIEIFVGISLFVILILYLCFVCYRWGKAQAQVEIVEKIIYVHNEAENKYVEETKKLAEQTKNKDEYRDWADTPVNPAMLDWLHSL